MHAVELYKKLPRKQCGECRQKTCMPFALAVVRGEATLSECPHMDAEAQVRLSEELTQTDWKEALIATLTEEIKGIPFKDVAEGIGGELRGDALVLRCLGREYAVSADGEITSTGHLTPWMKILFLQYIKTAGSGPLSGQWISFSDLRGGMVKAAALSRECEAPLRDLFERDPHKVIQILEALGADQRSDFATAHAWRLFLLPRIPVVLLRWAAEEEFGSTVKLLFDRSADRFLDVESLIFLVEGLVKEIEARLQS